MLAGHSAEGTVTDAFSQLPHDLDSAAFQGVQSAGAAKLGMLLLEKAVDRPRTTAQHLEDLL
jgi:hypothetical protein